MVCSLVDILGSFFFLSPPVIKKITSFFPSDFESVFALSLKGLGHAILGNFV